MLQLTKKGKMEKVSTEVKISKIVAKTSKQMLK